MQTTAELITDLSIQNTELRNQLIQAHDADLRLRTALGLYHTATEQEVLQTINKLQLKNAFATSVLNS